MLESAAPMAAAPSPAPLLDSDPPRIGDFWLDARLASATSGVAYLGHAPDQPEAMIIALSAGASTDAAARDRLAGEVNKLHEETVLARGGEGQDGGRLAHLFYDEPDDPRVPATVAMMPWVALAYDGSPDALAEANRLLASVNLSATPAMSTPSGPDYEMDWTRDTRLGNWRVWPSSWPGRHDRAGWVPLFVSWLLTLVMCGLALLIAVLIFQNAPPEVPEPPVGGDGSSGSSSSADPSDSQPSPTSGSPESPAGYDSPSKDPSMAGGEGDEATTTATPNPKNTRL